jgi:polyhydroxybutyrate depolymerase
MTEHSIDVAGRTRTFTLVNGDRGPALVLVFHGSKQSGAKHRAFTGGVYEKLPAAVAYLDGYRGNWNDARKQSSFPARTENVDDVAFARAVVATLAESHGIDPRRVYASGYSNGGQMVMRLLHETPDLLAGAAVIAATMPAAGSFLVPGTPASLPLLLIHGTRDPIVSYDGGEMKWWARALFKVGGSALSMPQTARYFAGQEAAVETTRVSADVERAEYRLQGRPPVVLYTIRGGGHTVPGPVKAPALLGRTNGDVDAADLMRSVWGLADSARETQNRRADGTTAR